MKHVPKGKFWGQTPITLHEVTARGEMCQKRLCSSPGQKKPWEGTVVLETKVAKRHMRACLDSLLLHVAAKGLRAHKTSPEQRQPKPAHRPAAPPVSAGTKRGGMDTSPPSVPTKAHGCPRPQPPFPCSSPKAEGAAHEHTTSREKSTPSQQCQGSVYSQTLTASLNEARETGAHPVTTPCLPNGIITASHQADALQGTPRAQIQPQSSRQRQWQRWQLISAASVR